MKSSNRLASCLLRMLSTRLREAVDGRTSVRLLSIGDRYIAYAVNYEISVRSGPVEPRDGLREDVQGLSRGTPAKSSSSKLLVG